MTRILIKCILVGLIFPTATTAVRSLRIASPLQALTIWDKEPTTPRGRFLPRFRAGLQAEQEVRQEYEAASKASSGGAGAAATGEDWAQQAAVADQKNKSRVERAAAHAFEQAFKAAEKQTSETVTAAVVPPRSNKYQFVGVINPEPAQRPITWYARPKPANANWSVRLVHVNRQAILYDLFRRGKVDFFAKYQNQGQKVVNEETGESTRQPVIGAKYTVRERSWKYVYSFMIMFVCPLILHSESQPFLLTRGLSIHYTNAKTINRSNKQ